MCMYIRLFLMLVMQLYRTMDGELFWIALLSGVMGWH
jgi:hypothetical protein